jgi:hypothetical protein
MEKKQKSCSHCRRSFTPTRNPRQHYCSQQACQNARKYEWRKQKRSSDNDYKENQRRANQSWQQCHPDYWRNYRQSHPDYAQRNREQTRSRRQQKQCLNASDPASKDDASQFAKSDAFPRAEMDLSLLRSGTYRLTPASCAEFAKSDALIVSLSVVAGA